MGGITINKAMKVNGLTGKEDTCEYSNNSIRGHKLSMGL